MKVNIIEMSDGSFGIIDQNGQAVTTYSRARDARRGARRRGFVPVG